VTLPEIAARQRSFGARQDLAQRLLHPSAVFQYMLHEGRYFDKMRPRSQAACAVTESDLSCVRRGRMAVNHNSDMLPVHHAAF
jgi:hypothetical protein